LRLAEGREEQVFARADTSIAGRARARHPTAWHFGFT
jgi:hypothetical protein